MMARMFMVHRPKRKEIWASLHVPANDIVAPGKTESSDYILFQQVMKRQKAFTGELKLNPWELFGV